MPDISFRLDVLKMKKNSSFIILGMILLIAGCTKDGLPDDMDGPSATPMGKLQVKFEITHPWIPSDRIIRAGLHVAKTAMEMYRGEYIQSANVNNTNLYYSFNLEPGTYYVEAIIACICGGDSCSAGGFPGYAPAFKHTTEPFTIVEDEVTTVVPNFY